MSGQAVTAAAEKGSRSPPIKTRTEKQEKIFRLLQESLSKRIPEREKEKKEKEKEGDKEGEGSLSPSSTVSSSGEVEGVYTLYTSSLSSGGESGELSCDQSHAKA